MRKFLVMGVICTSIFVSFCVIMYASYMDNLLWMFVAVGISGISAITGELDYRQRKGLRPFGGLRD